MSFLYIVATPIGNLQDISQRALEVLNKVDVILCEDTRVTQKLLNHFNIKTRVLSYHQHSRSKRLEVIINLLQNGKNLALVSDSGTPGISDPGNKLVQKVAELTGEKVQIIPVPGPSAAIAAASVSGFPMDKFVFLGFPPSKKKRKKFFKEVLNFQYPVVFYESPHRILKTLDELGLSAKTYGLKPKIVVCRELTKKFETIYRGEIEGVVNEIQRDQIKGEFVVVVLR